MSTTSKDVKRARSFSQPRCDEGQEREQIKNKSVSRKSSRKEYSVEKCVEDGEETEKVQLRPVRLRLSRPSLRGEAKPPSESGSERTSTASTETDYSDKPVPYELDNKFDNEKGLKLLPPQPRFKPNAMEGQSSTSSYYARVRTRAKGHATTATNEQSSAPSSATVSRKFDPHARKLRSKTIEIGFTVPEKIVDEQDLDEEDKL